MRMFPLFLMLLLPFAASADPSQASFQATLGQSTVAGVIKVMPTTEKEPWDSGLPFWIVMPSVINTPRTFQIERIEFEGGEVCEKTACSQAYVQGRRVEPGEQFLIMASQKISSMTLNMSNGASFEHYAKIDAPFERCVKDVETLRGFSKKAWRQSRPNAAKYNLVDRGEDLVLLLCVK